MIDLDEPSANMKSVFVLESTHKKQSTVGFLVIISLHSNIPMMTLTLHFLFYSHYKSQITIF